MSTEKAKEQAVQEFTKADLKDGMVVEDRSNNMYMVLGDKFLNNSGYNNLYGFDKYLSDISFNAPLFDIVKVFVLKIDSIHKIGDVFDYNNLELIWERKESKEMTAEEMRQKLEELTGEKIEIKLSVDDKRVALTNYCKSREKCHGCIFNNDTDGCFGMQKIFDFEDEDVKNLYNRLKQNN